MARRSAAAARSEPVLLDENDRQEVAESRVQRVRPDGSLAPPLGICQPPRIRMGPGQKLMRPGSSPIPEAGSARRLAHVSYRAAAKYSSAWAYDDI